VQGAAAARSTPYHAVRFYENEKSLAQIVGDFLAAGLTAGHPAIVVATAAARAAILRELASKGVDVAQLQRSGDLVLLDAQETLDTFMVDAKPDPARFKDVMCGVLSQTCGERSDCTVRIYGEMVDVLWKQGKQDAALRLEMLWNQLAASEAFSLLCGYAMGNFYKDIHVDEVCQQHTHLIAASGKPEVIAARKLPPQWPRAEANERPRRSKPRR
jgi:hypothetical protein